MKHIVRKLLITILLVLISAATHPTYGADASSERDSPYVKEFTVPLQSSGPLGIAAAEDGIIWFTLEGANGIGSFNPMDQTFRLYKIPWEPEKTVKQYGLDGIVVDSQGVVWFTHGSTNRIGKLDPKTGSFRGLQLQTMDATPVTLVFDKTGNLWFTQLRGNKIGMLSPDDRLSEFELPNKMSGPAGLAFDANGKLWFTEAFGRKIGVFDPKTKNISEYVPPPQLTVFSPVGIAVDEDGVVWFADHGGSELVRFEPSGNAWKKYFTSRAPPEIYPASIPNDVEVDEHGFLWIAEHAGNKIARFDRKTGLLTEFTIPTFRATALWLTLDQHVKVWFAEAEGNKIGVIDTSQPIPFSISIQTQSLTVEAGGEGNVRLTVNSAKVLNGTLALETYGAPKSASFRFEPDQIKVSNVGEFTSEIKIRIDSNAKEGTYPVAVSASDGLVTQVLTLNLMVSSGGFSVPNQQLLLAIGIIAAAGITVALVAIRRRH